MKRYVIPVVTDAGGAATVYSPTRVTGEVKQIEYVPDGVDPLANTADFVITGNDTGINLWTESNIAQATAVRAPRQPAHSQVGAALLYAAGGTAVAVPIALANDKIKIVIAQGGNAKKGTFHITVG